MIPHSLDTPKQLSTGSNVIRTNLPATVCSTEQVVLAYKGSSQVERSGYTTFLRKPFKIADIVSLSARLISK